MQFQHSLLPLLQQRAAEGNPIRLGLLGCGSMGGDLLDQMRLIDGMSICAIADRRPEKIFQQLLDAGVDKENIVEIQSSHQILSCRETPKIAITDDLDSVARAEGLEAIIDATGKPSVGAIHGLTALRHGKHLIMMNVESDVTVGTLLHREAKTNNVVYSLGAGDEPSSSMELVNFVQGMGFEVIAAGKGKNNPLVPCTNPQQLEAEAKRKRMNPRVLSEFVDGTKTMVEMTALANATGFLPDVPGMHGKDVALEHLHEVYIPEEAGGILKRRGVVEYSVGKGVAPGVFVVAHIDSPRLCARMDYLALGRGPFYTFFRPFHLTSLEVPLTCARAVLFGVSDMHPRSTPVAETTGRAKRDLAVGEILDGIGETCYHGWMQSREDTREYASVPLGLLEGSKVKRPIKQGELLCYSNVMPNSAEAIVRLRAEQDKLLKY